MQNAYCEPRRLTSASIDLSARRKRSFDFVANDCVAFKPKPCIACRKVCIPGTHLLDLRFKENFKASNQRYR
eukprot:scaffold846_cov336-Pavlova_lutheri.AAC.10